MDLAIHDTHDEGADDARPLVEFTKRVRREAAREWMLLLGSGSVVAATVGIVAVVMR